MLVSQVLYKNITAKTSAKCEMKESRSTKEIEKFRKKNSYFQKRFVFISILYFKKKQGLNY